ncbi:MAG: DegV family protein [Porcipelethomonas sp.]
MQKIKILTDSACDISAEDEKGLGIQILCFPVTVNGITYRERKDFTNEEFYRIMDNSKEIPVTSPVQPDEIFEVYKKLYNEGWTDVIHVTVSAYSSSTYENALSAAARFKREINGSDNKRHMNIHVVNSSSFSGVYGYPVMQAALKAQKGETPDEILDYLHEWFESAEMHFIPMNLKYVKKSAKINAFTAFTGELLGLRPLIKISGGTSEVIEKIRGEKNIVSRLADDAAASMVPKTPYIMVTGSDSTLAGQLAAELTGRFGYPPEWTVKIGASVACNSGPNVTGFIIRGRKR